MSQDERSLFGDEQAYITWKRQQQAEARAEALKAAQARKKQRRPQYSKRIQLALAQVKNHRRLATMRADPEQWTRYQRQEQRHRETRRRDPRRYEAQLTAQRRHYVNHCEEVRLRVAVYQSDPVVKARRAERERARRAAKKAAKE